MVMNDNEWVIIIYGQMEVIKRAGGGRDLDLELL